MKVIDLLNKIANGEKIKCFKCCDNLYIFNPEYESIEEMFYYDEINWVNRQNFDLNDEIEIIEDKPKKIDKIDLWTNDCDMNNKTVLSSNFIGIEDRLNEIIDYINNGDSNE